MENGKNIYSENTPEIVELAKLSEAADQIENELFVKYDVKRGLRDLNGKGVLTGLTRISEIVAKEEKDGKSIPKDGELHFRGYDVKKLGDHIRMIQILKTRFGEADKEIAVNFHGGINLWAELPLPNDIYDYDKYLTPDYLLNKEEDEIEIKEDNTTNNKFKLVI